MKSISVSRRTFLKTAALSAGLTAGSIGAPALIRQSAGASATNDFSFVAFADSHIQPERGAVEGFRMAINKMNSLMPKPAFVIGCGDLIFDALYPDYERVDLLCNLYNSTASELDMPLYNVVGNHDVFGWGSSSSVPESHPEYGKELFRKRFGNGKNYYSFDYHDWHFIALDSIGRVTEYPEESKTLSTPYVGYIDKDQQQWLKMDLEEVGPKRPIVIAMHITLFTFFFMVEYEKHNPDWMNIYHIANSQEIWKIIRPYNVKLVLQGDWHINEEMLYKTISIKSIGALCGAWWKGALYGHPEGFGVFKVRGGDFSWEYVPYGWKVRS